MWIYKVFQKDMSTLLNVHQFCLYNYLTDNNMLGKQKFILYMKQDIFSTK